MLKARECRKNDFLLTFGCTDLCGFLGPSERVYKCEAIPIHRRLDRPEAPEATVATFAAKAGGLNWPGSQ